VLRLVGSRIGPVLRNRPPIDSAAAQIEWSGSMDELAALRKPTGRFMRDPDRAGQASQDLIEH